MTKQTDDCVDGLPSADKIRRLTYYTGFLSPTLCGTDTINRLSFACHACLVSSAEAPCAATIGSSPSYAYLHAFGTYGGSISGIDGIRTYLMDVLDCDPFYAESADGKLVVTE